MAELRSSLDRRHAAGDVSLAYSVAGPEKASSVVLVHGLTGDATDWTDVADRLARTNRCFVVEQRGHGSSDRAPDSDRYRVEDYTADLASFLDDVVGHEAVVVGHSLGGLVAAHLAATSPDKVRAVFLEDPPLFLGDRTDYAQTLFALFFPLLRDLLRSFAEQGLDEEGAYEAIRGLPDASGAGTMEEVQGEVAVRQQARTWLDFDPDALGSAIDGTLWTAYDPTAPLNVPTRVLRAERELAAAFFPEHTEPFLSANPDAVVELVDGASHLIHQDRLDPYCEMVAAFLDSQSS